MRLENRAQNPTLAEVIQTAIDANLINLHVCLPAKIILYNASSQTATVLPSLLKTYENDLTLPWPPISNVPLIFPRAAQGQAYLHMPLLPGDDVTLLICERSLDNWKETGMISDPDDRRQFDITDCFAFPGGSAAPLAFNVKDSLAVEMANGVSVMQMNAVGQYAFKGGLQDELVTLIGDFIQAVASSFTATALGPQPLIDPLDPGFVLLLARIQAFKKVVP